MNLNPSYHELVSDQLMEVIYLSSSQQAVLLLPAIGALALFLLVILLITNQ